MEKIINMFKNRPWCVFDSNVSIASLVSLKKLLVFIFFTTFIYFICAACNDTDTEINDHDISSEGSEGFNFEDHIIKTYGKPR